MSPLPAWHDYFMIVGGAAATAFAAMPITIELYATALALMLIAGIRNARDMIIFLVTLPRTPE